MVFCMLERYDCIDWINWVNTEIPEKLPIYLAGVSMGAAGVLMTAGLEMPENVKGITADCGYTSAEAIWKRITSDFLHLSYSIRKFDIDRICRKKIHFAPGDCSTIDALRKSSVPVLFIHGTRDRFVPVEMTYQNYEACKSPKKLLIVPGAGHGMSYFMAQSEYEKTEREFWKECEQYIE